MIKNIYILYSETLPSTCGRERFLLPVTSFPTNLLYPLTLRVTGILLVLFSNEKFPMKFWGSLGSLLC